MRLVNLITYTQYREPNRGASPLTTYGADICLAQVKLGAPPIVQRIYQSYNLAMNEELKMPSMKCISEVQAMEDYIQSPVTPHIQVLARKYRVPPATVTEWMRKGDWTGLRSRHQRERHSLKLKQAGLTDANENTRLIYNNVCELTKKLVELQKNSLEAGNLTGIDKFVATYGKLLNIDRICRLSLGIINPEQY